MEKHYFQTVDPFNFDRLYGNEKYSLNDMLLKQASCPTWVEQGDQSFEIWSDRSRTEWEAALPLIESSYNGDAFFAGATDESFLAFASKVVSEVNKSEIKVTGAAIVRYTDMGGFPTLRLSAVVTKRKTGRQYGVPLTKPTRSEFMDEFGYHFFNER